MSQLPLIHRIYAAIFRIWRQKRHRLFLTRIVNPNGGPLASMLDVGGYPGYWTANQPVSARTVCLNIHEVDWTPSNALESSHHIELVVGDGCNMAEFPDHSFDLAFSNSVIEHVGNTAKQEAFAKEVRRVGRRVWVQTPAYECIIEPHYMAPFVHYFPKFLQKKLLRWISPWGWLQRPSQHAVDEMVDTTRLLTKREFSALFPDCEIVTERMLWIFPKSYIAIRAATTSEAPAQTNK